MLETCDSETVKFALKVKCVNEDLQCFCRWLAVMRHIFKITQLEIDSS